MQERAWSEGGRRGRVWPWLAGGGVARGGRAQEEHLGGAQGQATAAARCGANVGARREGCSPASGASSCGRRGERGRGGPPRGNWAGPPVPGEGEGERWIGQPAQPACEGGDSFFYIYYMNVHDILTALKK